MGSGKTTVGKKLAKKLSIDFIDLDEAIEKYYGVTIAQIFETQGEEYFRNLELKILKEQSTKENLLVSCGGGTPCFHHNMELMNTLGITVYLQMNADALYSRLLHAKKERPLLRNLDHQELKSYIMHKLSERESTYLQSKIIVSGLDLHVELLANQIKLFA